jgi:hypothetical protein
MRFMVEIDAGMEKANAIDASGGPGAMLAKLGERFKPEAVYGKASLRGAYIVVDLKSPALTQHPASSMRAVHFGTEWRFR